MADPRHDLTETRPDPTSAPAVWWRLTDLDPWNENPREYDKEAVNSLAGKILQHGFNTLIGAHWPTRRIVRGHRRRLAVLELLRRDPTWTIPGSPGPGFVPVRFRGGPWDGANNAEGDALADNREQENGKWDLEVLGGLFERWQQEGDQVAELVASTGFQDEEIRKIVAAMTPLQKRPGEVEAPPAPEPPRRSESVPGEVYQLGPHRLICGDCTDPEVVTRLMDGRQARSIFTDPPFAIYGSSTGLEASIADDKVVRPFFAAVLRSAVQAVRPFGAVYVCCDWRSWASWWDSAKPVKLAPANMLVWDKGSAGLGSNYANGHEIVGYFLAKPIRTKMFKAKTGVVPVLRPNMLRNDYGPADAGPARLALVDHLAPDGELLEWDAVEQAEAGEMPDGTKFLLKYGRVTGAERVHNAAKPIKLITELLEDSSKPGDVIVDFFGGSGTTLLACARSERTAYLTEIDPAWCDVIRHRWTLWAREAGQDPGPGALVMAHPPTMLGASSAAPTKATGTGAKAADKGKGRTKAAKAAKGDK